jgi:hypothetical protein
VEYFKYSHRNSLECRNLQKPQSGLYFPSENLTEGSCTGECVRCVKGRRWKWASFSIVFHWGTWRGGGGGVRLPGTLGDSKREACIWSISLYGSRTSREGSFNGNSETFIRKSRNTLEMRISLFLVPS